MGVGDLVVGNVKDCLLPPESTGIHIFAYVVRNVTRHRAGNGIAKDILSTPHYVTIHL